MKIRSIYMYGCLDVNIGVIIGVVYGTNLGIVAFEKGKPNIVEGNCNNLINKFQRTWVSVS